MNRLAMALLLLIPIWGCTVRPLREVAIRQPLGDSWITPVLYSTAPGSWLLLCNLHENEPTSVRAGLDLIRRRGGQVLALRHSGERLVAFELKQESFTFDPNRMFTDQGARDSLQRYGPSNDQALQAVRAFAEHLLADYGLEMLPLIVTLHNNSEGEYSAASYLPGGELARDAAAVHLEPGRDPDDFFFVTDESFFHSLKALRFNVVLQDNARATDDGSLSVLAARKGIPYVNVEAEHGHLGAQRKMLQALSRLIDQGSRSETRR